MFKLIFWIFILVLALSFFGLSLEAILSSPAGQANLNYISELFSQLWQWLISFVW